MDFRVIQGNFGGLRIYRDSRLFIYSEVKDPWFSGTIISIYNDRGFLILEAKQRGFFCSKYSILIKDDSILNGVFEFKKKQLVTSIGDFRIKMAHLGLIHSRFNMLLNSLVIGSFKGKFSKRREFDFRFSTSDDLKILYSCVYFLILKSKIKRTAEL